MTNLSIMYNKKTKFNYLISSLFILISYSLCSQQVQNEYTVKFTSEEIKIDPNEISEYGWFSISEFDNIEWVSQAMRDIASSSLDGKILNLTDYSSERKEHYFVFS